MPNANSQSPSISRGGGGRALSAAGFGFAVIAAVLAANPAAVAAPADAVPEGVTLPLVVWDVNFADNPLDAPPQPLTKKQIEAQNGLSVWQRLPIRHQMGLQYVTETRRALVVKEAAGLKDTPLLFTYTEGAEPNYGPMVHLSVPGEIAARGAVWRLTLDVAKGSVAISGGVELRDVGDLKFFEDGTVRCNGTEVARYAANRPLRVECLIDAVAKRVTITVDGDAARAVTLPWSGPGAEAFAYLKLHGLMPGGHSEAPSSIAFDNIKLVMEKAK